MRILSLVLVTALCAGCASSPSTPSPSAAPAAQSKAAPAAPAAAAPAAAASSSSVPYGYKVKTRDGVTVYCKKVATVGTRVAQETCMSEAEMKALESQAASDRDQFRRNQTLCGTGGCGGG